MVRGSQLPGRPKTGQANHERLQTAAGEGIMDRMESNTFFAQATVPYFVLVIGLQGNNGAMKTMGVQMHHQ